MLQPPSNLNPLAYSHTKAGQNVYGQSKAPHEEQFYQLFAYFLIDPY